ncbi:MAG TPA: hypothetical protein VFZ61_27485, partial [Polyangiales bacterium]
LEATCAPDCPPSSSEPGRDLALAADLSLGLGVAVLAGAGAWALGSWLHERSATQVSWTPLRNGMFAAVTTRY